VQLVAANAFSIAGWLSSPALNTGALPMRTFFAPALLLAAALAAGGARANPVEELRNRLAGFSSSEQIAMRADVRSNGRSGEGKEQKPRQTQAVVLIEDGPLGLKLGWTSKQVQAAREEGRLRAVNAEAETPNLDALTAIDARQAAQLLDYASALHQQLTGAELLEDKQDTWQGRPARLLRIKPALALGKDEKKAIKSIESEMRVWLDADGVPLAVERKYRLKGSRFLISFEAGESSSVTLGRVKSRLVATSSSRESEGSGMGYSSQERTVITLQAI
jgi:hypothetical protein